MKEMDERQIIRLWKGQKREILRKIQLKEIPVEGRFVP